MSFCKREWLVSKEASFRRDNTSEPHQSNLFSKHRTNVCKIEDSTLVLYLPREAGRIGQDGEVSETMEPKLDETLV